MLESTSSCGSRRVTLLKYPAIYIVRSVLLVEETGGPGENHRPVASR
jgi:hypothetical protein